MRRRRGPVQPHVNPITAASSTISQVGLDRGRPPPPPPPPEQARLFVYRSMLMGASREQIAEMDAAQANQIPPATPFGRELIFRVYTTICRELGDAASLPEHSRETLRAQATERLRRELALLRSKRTLNSTVPELIAITREVRHLESLLADIEGTKQLEVHVGIDVDVRVRSASMRVVANLTRDEFAEMGRELLDGGRR